MIKSNNYAKQQFELTIEDLIINPESVQIRLLSVFISHLCKLNENDFSDKLKPKWNKLHDLATKRGDRVIHTKFDIGSYKNTIKRYYKKTAMKLSKLIYEIYYDLNVEI